MSTPKKPKARRMWTDAEWQDGEGSVLWGSSMRNRHSVPVAVLDVSDEAALIEVAAEAMYGGPACWNAAHAYTKHLQRDDARAALTALGVLPKRRGK